LPKIKSSFTIWNPRTWFGPSTNAIEDIECQMMRYLKSKVTRYNVNIRNNSLQIWTISANAESKSTPIVLVHGFCGGVALWIHNIDALSETRPFYAFDLLGFGRSSRPPFSTDPIVAEAQFIESIEDWRKEVGLDEFILLGHSFGGYLATAYAIKYPQCVKALILADPWGFPEIPNPSHKPDTQMPLWINAIAKVSRYVSPLSVFRITGQIGVFLFKQLRPDFKRKYITLLDDPDVVYDYLYYANSLSPT
jgi:pimeloyl-ACP methyl ester carboxylesterase